MTSTHRFLLIVSMLLAVATMAACRSSDEPTAEPMPTREEAAPEEQPTTAPPSDAWERIQESGSMIVGTSADYPPFESHDDDFDLTGFDIALMEAIADEIGVEVEFKDIAFDGLGAALTVGQVDAAIAAISVTAERQDFVDFTHIYLVSEDAYVAAADSDFDPIEAVEDLAGYRVGVQRGSVFQDWLEEEIVETGLMAPTDLFVYPIIEEAFDDLTEGRVDLLVLDLLPAELAVEDGDFEIAAQGLNRERYAVAVAKGQNDLRTRINQALIALARDGVVGELAEEYLGLEPIDLLPIPTPDPNQPTSVPVPPPTGDGCVDGMAWVADLTYDDQNMSNPPVMRPGEVFQKGWRVLNTGTCTWDSTYSLQFAHGNQPGAQMGGQPVTVQGTVAPGATYDFTVNLVAPLRPGVYMGVWQMKNGQSRAFGERVYVAVSVQYVATATPAPTQTPSPSINFTADKTTLNQGECTIIRWDVKSIDSVYFYKEGQNWQDHGVAGQGSREVCPSQTTTYYLRVVNTDGSVETRSLTVTVVPNLEAPVISRFTIDPSGQIGAGDCVSLRWDVTGDVDTVTLSRNGEVLWAGAPLRGSYPDCPPGTGGMSYVLEATGPGGSSRATQHVTVVPDVPTATPVPTGVPEPEIDAFSVLPEVIEAGGCVSIAWSTSGGTEKVTILKDGVVVQENAGLSGQVSDCLSAEGTVDYRLEARNRVGTMVSAGASVQVVGSVEPTVEPPTDVPPTDEPAPTEAPATEPSPTEAPPVISDFTASPPQIDSANACTTLTWTVTGTSLSLVTLARNTEVIATDPVSPYQDCVDASLAGTTITYVLKADSEFGGSDAATVEVVYAGQ